MAKTHTIDSFITIMAWKMARASFISLGCRSSTLTIQDWPLFNTTFPSSKYGIKFTLVIPVTSIESKLLILIPIIGPSWACLETITSPVSRVIALKVISLDPVITISSLLVRVKHSTASECSLQGQSKFNCIITSEWPWMIINLHFIITKYCLILGSYITATMLGVMTFKHGNKSSV